MQEGQNHKNADRVELVEQRRATEGTLIVEARVRKAKELLTTGNFTISEAAYHVRFVDQSHLTRHFKRIYGLAPLRV
jgi:AraC-like DNA-binding protein